MISESEDVVKKAKVELRRLSMAEFAKVLGVVRRTPNMMNSRDQITTIIVRGRTIVIPDSKTLTFVWNWLVANKIPPESKEKIALPAKQKVPKPRIFAPRNPVEKKLVGKRRLVHRDVAQKYLKMCKKEFEKFCVEHLDKVESVRGIGYWPAELLEEHRATHK